MKNNNKNQKSVFGHKIVAIEKTDPRQIRLSVYQLVTRSLDRKGKRRLYYVERSRGWSERAKGDQDKDAGKAMPRHPLEE